MTTESIERAAEAMDGIVVWVGYRDEAGDDASADGTLDTDDRRRLARAALTAAVDPDELVRLQREHTREATMNNTWCTCGRWPYDERDDETPDGFRRHLADVMVAHLTGGGS